MNVYDESVRRTEAFLKRELFLGRGKHTGRPYYLALSEYLLTHTHLVGAPGYGKSFYIEHLLRKYMDLRIPASLIDPHGDQAQHYYQYLIRNARLLRQRNILRFAPGAPTNALGFSPFHCNLPDPAEVASLVLEAFVKVWGEKSFNETPRLERILRAMFHMFAANNIPLTEAYQFLLVQNRAFRERLLPAVEDERLRQNWREIEQLTRSEKLERFESSWNRLQRFLALPAVSNLFAAEGRSLRFPEMFAKGDVLVADLSRLHSKEAQSLVGTMMVNALYYAAKLRPRFRRSPCVVAIDEFPKFVTATIADSLDELRKFGVRLTLAHQHLPQLTPELRGAILGDAKIKVVFGGLSREDAEVLARELFTGQVSGDRVKYVNVQTKFRPVLEEREVETWSETEGESDSESDGWSDGYSSGGGNTDASSTSRRLLEEEETGDETATYACSSSSSFSSMSGHSGARTRGASRSRSRSHGLTYVTEHEEFREETSRQFCSLEEEWEKLVGRLMSLDPREAIVKAFNRRAIDVLTPEVRQLPALPTRRRMKPKNSQPPPAPPSSFDDPPEDFRE